MHDTAGTETKTSTSAAMVRLAEGGRGEEGGTVYAHTCCFLSCCVQCCVLTSCDMFSLLQVALTGCWCCSLASGSSLSSFLYGSKPAARRQGTRPCSCYFLHTCRGVSPAHTRKLPLLCEVAPVWVGALFHTHGDFKTLVFLSPSFLSICILPFVIVTSSFERATLSSSLAVRVSLSPSPSFLSRCLDRNFSVVEVCVCFFFQVMCNHLYLFTTPAQTY